LRFHQHRHATRSATGPEKRNLPYSGYTDLASRDEVCALVRECVEKVNADLSQEAEIANSQIHRFLGAAQGARRR
jgi:hypothetical protein